MWVLVASAPLPPPSHPLFPTPQQIVSFYFHSPHETKTPSYQLDLATRYTQRGQTHTILKGFQCARSLAIPLPTTTTFLHGLIPSPRWTRHPKYRAESRSFSRVRITLLQIRSFISGLRGRFVDTAGQSQENKDIYHPLHSCGIPFFPGTSFNPYTTEPYSEQHTRLIPQLSTLTIGASFKPPSLAISVHNGSKED